MWPQDGEIDIMEQIGREPSKVHGTIHYGNAWPNNSHQGNSVEIPAAREEAFSDDFHIFAVEREENEIRWLLDDVVYSTKTPADITPHAWPFEEDFHFILNVAVGGNWPQNPDDSTVFPTDMEVDYVRVWEGNLPTMEGSQVVNPDDLGVVYKIANGLPGSSYEWRVQSGDSVTIVSGEGSDSITVDVSSTASPGTKDEILVDVKSPCGFERTYRMAIVVSNDVSTCAAYGVDPYFQDNGICCMGLERCLADWNGNGNWYYLCYNCCEAPHDCGEPTAAPVPAPTEAPAGPISRAPSAPSCNGPALIWSDEFDGTSLDLSKWAHQNGNGCPDLCGWGNNELQSYTTENLSVSGGVMKIEARRSGNSYTSSKILSKGLADFGSVGRFEAR